MTPSERALSIEMMRIWEVWNTNIQKSDNHRSNADKRKIPWLLGKMFESGFPDASGREDGLMSGLAPGLGPVSG
jgi:hypothetical protein